MRNVSIFSLAALAALALAACGGTQNTVGSDGSTPSGASTFTIVSAESGTLASDLGAAQYNTFTDSISAIYTPSQPTTNGLKTVSLFFSSRPTASGTYTFDNSVLHSADLGPNALILQFTYDQAAYVATGTADVTVSGGTVQVHVNVTAFSLRNYLTYPPSGVSLTPGTVEGDLHF